MNTARRGRIDVGRLSLEGEDAMEILTCRDCGHQRRLTREVFRAWGIQIASMSPEDVRAVLSRHNARVACQNCGARGAGIHTEEHSQSLKEKRVFGPPSPDVEVTRRALRGKTKWLYPGELELLRSLLDQAQRGKHLSPKQRRTVEQIKERASERKKARIVSGGAPGTGRRR